MELSMQLLPEMTRERVKVQAVVEDPWVERLGDKLEPVVLIEDCGVMVEIRFSGPERLADFMQRVADLNL